MKKINTWLTQRISLFVLLALACGYFLPLDPNPVLQYIVIALFGYMTFTTSLTTSFREFIKIVRRPKMPVYTLCIVHIAIPFAAWMVGILVFPENHLVQIGFLIGSAVPVGITSLIWAHIVKGNVPLALVIVSLDTILAPLLLPLFILFVVGAVISIDYPKMIIELLFMISLPSVAGMLIHDYAGGRARSFSEGFGGVLSRIAFFGIIFINSCLVLPFIVWGPLILKIVLVAAFIAAFGYFIGYVAGRAVTTDRSTIVSMVYSTGMRNIATGLVIATSYFSYEAAVPIALAMLFQQPFAAFTAKIFQYRFS